MSHVSENIDRIRLAGSRKQKQDLLKRFCAADDTGLLRRVIKYGMDPTITFNVGKRSVEWKPSNNILHPTTTILTHKDLDYLEQLASRRINRTTGAAWVNDRVKSLYDKEAELLIQILDKDLSWGLGAGSVNEVIPGLITEFACMLATPFEKADIQYPCRVEPKYDGMRVLAFVEGGEVSFYTRSGKPVTSLPPGLEKECIDLANMLPDGPSASVVLDGEIMGEDFKETMERARRKSESFDTAQYYVFDWLPRAAFNNIGKEPYTQPYSSRRAALQEAMARQSRSYLVLPPSYMASSEEEVTYYYDFFRDQGLEGAIVKSSKGPYVGRRSTHWVKLKAEETEDLEIIGFEEGEGKKTGMLGALIVNRQGVTVRVGTGFSDDERTAIWSNPSLYMNKLVEVQFQEVTPDGSLRHPRFIRLRMDKSEW